LLLLALLSAAKFQKGSHTSIMMKHPKISSDNSSSKFIKICIELLEKSCKKYRKNETQTVQKHAILYIHSALCVGKD